MTVNRTLVTLSILALSGCVGGQEPAVGQASHAVTIDNGRTINGRTINGRTINGRTINGRTINGRTINGRTINGVSVNGSAFHVVLDDGTRLTGYDIEGAVLDAEMDDGTQIKLTFETVEHAVGYHADLWYYGVSYETANNDVVAAVRCYGAGQCGEYIEALAVGEPVPPPDKAFASLPIEKAPPVVGREYVCGVDDDGFVIAATPILGQFDYRVGVTGAGGRLAGEDPLAITFACQGYALAKCEELGYETSESVVECNSIHDCRKVPLKNHHEACVRLLRADYCGDGESWTMDGTPIDLWDSIDTQTPTGQWPFGGYDLFEGEVSTRGYECIVNTRWDDIIDDDGVPRSVGEYVTANCPWLASPEENRTCGGGDSSFFADNFFGSGMDPLQRTYLMNESGGLLKERDPAAYDALVAQSSAAPDLAVY